MKKILLTFILTSLCLSVTQAQGTTEHTGADAILNFLEGAGNNYLNDTETLIEGYMAPFGEWFGTGLNAGWYNTGKPHQFPGFDVTAGVHFIRSPESAMVFSPNLIALSPEHDELSTILGLSNSTDIFYTNPATGNMEPIFTSPGGLNWGGLLVMPYLQGSIGLIKNTEILFRLAPKVDVDNLSVGFWGLGFKHDIKQWIPGIKILPFDLSFVAGYSTLKSSLEFGGNNLGNERIQEGNMMHFDVKAFNSNLVLSKKLSILTPYIGIGYQYSQAHLALKGQYYYTSYDNEFPMHSTPIQDPFDFSFGGVNGLKATIGARLKLFLFTLHVDWSKAKYDVFTVGIGLNSDIGSKLVGNKIDKVITE